MAFQVPHRCSGAYRITTMTTKFLQWLAMPVLLAAPAFADIQDVSTQVAPGVILQCDKPGTGWCSQSYVTANFYKFYLNVGSLAEPNHLAFWDAIPGSLINIQQTLEWTDTPTFGRRPTGAPGTLVLTFQNQGGTSFSASLGGFNSTVTPLSGNGTESYVLPLTFGIATPMSWTFQDNLPDNGNIALLSFKVYDQSGVLVHSLPSGLNSGYAPEPGTLGMPIIGAAAFSILWWIRRRRSHPARA